MTHLRTHWTTGECPNSGREVVLNDGQILALWDAGWSAARIAKKVGHDHKVIKRFLERKGIDPNDTARKHPYRTTGIQNKGTRIMMIRAAHKRLRAKGVCA